MAKYSYPAIFTMEKSGIAVRFPDIEGAYTSGIDMAESIYMAEDVLANVLFDLELSGEKLPTASKYNEIITLENEMVNYIYCDTEYYWRKHNTKVVKKTLTIPSWLNEKAIALNINFSETLKDALIEKIGL